MELKVKLDTGAKMPTLAHDSDAGYDLYSREFRCIYPGCRYSFDTGVHVAIPKGYFGKIESKSGLNAKHGLTCTGEKCPLKGMLEELQGGVESCTAHNCPNRTVPVTDDEPPKES